MRRAAGIAAALALCGLAGCQSFSLTRSSTLGVAGYSFANGKASQGFAAPPGEVRAATIEAMRGLRMGDIRQGEEAGVIKLSAITADRRLCDVTIVTSSAFSLVTAKVGTLGDRMQSQTLMSTIAARLNRPATDQGPADVEVEPADAEAPDDLPEAEAGDDDGGWMRRDAVPDEVMLKDQLDAGYRDSATP